MLGVMFSAAREKSASALAGVFRELLLPKDCYLRALGMLTREVVRCLRQGRHKVGDGGDESSLLFQQKCQNL